jgi:transcriptional regulator with PAS, ATPase and Fis domain
MTILVNHSTWLNFNSYQKALEASDLKQEVVRLRTETKKDSAPNIIGESRQIKYLMEVLDKVARSEASTVLVQGESGTGKELVAKWIHYSSNRAEKPFIAINCAAVPATLLESELFGHEKGAFTDAKATKKGLFELQMVVQYFSMKLEIWKWNAGKVAAFLEDRSLARIGGSRVFTVDVRIISATNKDLQNQLKKNISKRPLLPIAGNSDFPAEKRKEDIIPLATHFIGMYNRDFNKKCRILLQWQSG